MRGLNGMPSPKILFVEDDPKAAQVISKYLKSKGLEIFLALDGQKGLQLFKKTAFDLVITDVNLPRIDGIKLCNYIKTSAATPKPVIMICAADVRERLDQELPKKSHPDHFLIKPFQMRVLLEKIGEFTNWSVPEAAVAPKTKAKENPPGKKSPPSRRLKPRRLSPNPKKSPDLMRPRLRRRLRK